MQALVKIEFLESSRNCLTPKVNIHLKTLLTTFIVIYGGQLWSILLGVVGTICQLLMTILEKFGCLC